MGNYMVSKVKKKTIELDQDAVDKVRMIFGVKTDKEALNLALKTIAAEDEIIRAQRALAGKLDLEDRFR